MPSDDAHTILELTLTQHCNEPPSMTATISAPPHVPDAPARRVTVCGTFRRAREQLVADYEELLAAGCRVISPVDIQFVAEREGFVYASAERDDAPTVIEERHLEAMLAAEFIWLHAPDGYVGRSAAMELGFARAQGLDVFARTAPRDPAFRGFVRVADSPTAAMTEAARRMEDAPADALGGLQRYYERVARDRGYDLESPQDCMLLLTEEIGELARAVRKTVGLAREGGYDEAAGLSAELADVQLYILHLANVMDVDLAAAVVTKERTNAQRHAERELPRAA